MFRISTKKITFLAASIALLFPAFATACASCGCTLSSDWDGLGNSSKPGFKMDLRYDYLNQDQLRSGTSAISPSAASQIIRNGETQEVEKYTKNNYITVGLDYSRDLNWGVNLQIPYIDRKHSTLGSASDGYTGGDDGGQYDSHTRSIGDVKIIGRYQGFSEEHTLGLLFGLKLPTGSHTETGISTDPGAPGVAEIDRGLQAGSGTTDLILGGYFSDSFSANWDYFSQVMVQTALNSKDGFTPGNGINLNAGVRYTGFSDIKPLLQVNAKYVQHDTGVNADTVSTGGTLMYLSPGAVLSINQQLSLYAFVQLPIYQNVRGLQLTPRYTASIGAKLAF